VTGSRKLIAYIASLLAILLAGWAATWAHPLPEKGLEIVCYAIGMCFGLYVGANVGEHFSKRKSVTKVDND
jgi:uncharacterized membrane protein YfcA